MFAILVRAFRTFLESAVAILIVEQFTGDEVDLIKLITISVITAILSVLMAILSVLMGIVTGVPEARTEGELTFNTHIENSSVIAGLSLDKSITPEYIDDLTTRGTINLRIRRDYNEYNRDLNNNFLFSICIQRILDGDSKSHRQADSQDENDPRIGT